MQTTLPFTQTIKPPAIIKKQEPEPPKPVLYTVSDGQTLTSIAEATGSSVGQLWAANTQLSNPDQITPGDALTVPQKPLPDRPLPITVEVQSPSASTYNSPPARGAVSVSSGAYGTGWCTSYAASRHPVPGNLGNADSWLYMARVDGLATGYVPRPGSIAVAAAYMHVAIVEQIDGDKILVSEQNYQGYGVVSSRWTPLSEWAGYIY